MNITAIEVEPVTWKVHDHRLECGTEFALSCRVKAHKGKEATHFLILRGPGEVIHQRISICDICMDIEVREILGMLDIEYREEG